MESSNFSQQEDPSKKGPPSEEKWEEDTDLAVFFEDLSKLEDYELSEDGLSTHEVSSTTSAAGTPSGTQKPATSIDATATVASFKAAAVPQPPPQVRVLHSQGNWNITTPQKQPSQNGRCHGHPVLHRHAARLGLSESSQLSPTSPTQPTTITPKPSYFRETHNYLSLQKCLPRQPSLC